MLGCSWRCQGVEKSLPRGRCLWPEESTVTSAWSTVGTAGLLFFVVVGFFLNLGFLIKKKRQLSGLSRKQCVCRADPKALARAGGGSEPLSWGPGVLPTAPRQRSGGNLPAAPGAGGGCGIPGSPVFSEHLREGELASQAFSVVMHMEGLKATAKQRTKACKEENAVIKQQRFGG